MTNPIDELIEKLNARSERKRYSGGFGEAKILDEAASALTSLQERNRKLEEALAKLANEVDALGAFEDEIREVIGNTNWSILRSRLNEARALLSGGGE